MRRVETAYQTDQIFMAWYWNLNYKAYIVKEYDWSVALKIVINDVVAAYQYCQTEAEAYSMESDIRLWFGICFGYIKDLIF